MRVKIKSRNDKRKVRHFRTRRKINGTPERPRMSVFRSNKNIYVQIIDDVNGNTLASSSSKELKINKKNIEACKLVGKEIAIKAKEKGIEKVVFDSSGYQYSARLAALADAARENGLNF